MGSRLVSLVLARWTHVSDRAFRVLVRMAHTALDEPKDGQPAGLYFGGRDLLAMTLRNERGGKPDSLARSVRYALDELIEAGAIKRLHHGRAGRNTVYELTLANEPAVRKTGQGESHVPPEEESSVPPQGESHVPPRGNPAFPPRNHKEPVEELLEDQEINLRTAVTVSRAREAATDSIDSLKPRNPPLRVIPGGLSGHGFCLACHADGKVALAADRENGALCAYHLKAVAS